MLRGRGGRELGNELRDESSMAREWEGLGVGEEGSRA